MLKRFKPTTSSRRGLVLTDRSGLHRRGPEKSLSYGKKSTGGRNFAGRITADHRGGGHKRKYRAVDFYRGNGRYKLLRLEYDPSRSAFITLVENMETKEKSYRIATKDFKAGNIIESSDKCEISDGNTMKLYAIPIGEKVHNVAMYPNGKAKYARAAGTYATKIGTKDHHCIMRLSSGEVVLINGECKATLGVVSNIDHKNEKSAKAGRSRHQGWRPHVRGTAMNSVDHRMGGGRGKSKGNRHPSSAKGLLSKGFKTRSVRKNSDNIVSRRKRR